MRKPQAQSGRYLAHPFSGWIHLRRLETSVARFGGFSIAVAGVLLYAVAIPALAGEGAIKSQPGSNIHYILVGFAGGFVRHNNPHHGPVQLAERLRREASDGTYIEVFENRRRKKAYKTILRLLDANHDGTLSDEEKSEAHLILFGHSWGASAVVLLARELDQLGIPVLLTVQVDSIDKLWQHDRVIPDNVAAAVNFYQPHGLIHGLSEIKAEDESKTQILGNYRFDYRKNPVRCEGTSWFDRTFTPSHMQSQCDPHIWNRVEELVLERMEAAPSIAVMSGQ